MRWPCCLRLRKKPWATEISVQLPTSSNGCVLVVCPLKRIIFDQIEEGNSLGLTALEIENLGMFENLPRLLYGPGNLNLSHTLFSS